MQRSMQTTIAAVLNFLFSIVSIVLSLPLLAGGAAAIEAGVDGPPFFVVLLSVVIGVIGLVSSWGLWKNQRWAKILTIVINAVGGLSALPGVLWAEGFALRMSAMVGTLIPVIIIVLLLWKTPQQVTATS